MTKQYLFFLFGAALASCRLGLAQQPAGGPDMLSKIVGGQLPALAVPDLRGSGEAQQHMSVFNQTLFADLQEARRFRMAPKSLYPIDVPQQPQDFKPPAGNPPVRQGPWLTDWANPPVSANFFTIGYTAVQNGRLVLFGWLFSANQPDLQNAQVFGKIYFGTLDEAGARQVAHDFAADVLAKFGETSLAGSKIYFTSNRTGSKEIWVMDPDGANQKQLTRHGSITNFAAISADKSRLAYVTYASGSPQIRLMSLETNRNVVFYNQRASMNSNPEFTPDGKLLFSSTAAGKSAQIYICNMDGSGLRRLSDSPAIEVEPKVNPKTGSEIIFTSGRSGPPQIYKMNLDGTDVSRLTTGDGDAVNPSWHPSGQYVAFSWTRGYDPGNFNLFVMDVASRDFVQLTRAQGRNENPTWAPDGRHLVFSSDRSGKVNQIWTMLVDGTNQRQLTTVGANTNPVWIK